MTQTPPIIDYSKIKIVYIQTPPIYCGSATSAGVVVVEVEKVKPAEAK